MLKDSKIMGIVERWAKHLAEGQTKDIDFKDTDSSDPGTPVRPGSSTPRLPDTPSSTASLPSTPISMPYESIPHKKRRLLQRLQLQREEASSSDSELSDAHKVQKSEKATGNEIKAETTTESEVTTKPSTNQEETIPGITPLPCEESETPAAAESEPGNSTVNAETGATSSLESGQGDVGKLPVDKISNMASDLLGEWGDLTVCWCFLLKYWIGLKMLMPCHENLTAVLWCIL